MGVHRRPTAEARFRRGHTQPAVEEVDGFLQRLSQVERRDEQQLLSAHSSQQHARSPHAMRTLLQQSSRVTPIVSTFQSVAHVAMLRRRPRVHTANDRRERERDRLRRATSQPGLHTHEAAVADPQPSHDVDGAPNSSDTDERRLANLMANLMLRFPEVQPGLLEQLLAACHGHAGSATQEIMRLTGAVPRPTAEWSRSKAGGRRPPHRGLLAGPPAMRRDRSDERELVRVELD